MVTVSPDGSRSACLFGACSVPHGSAMQPLLWAASSTARQGRREGLGICRQSGPIGTLLAPPRPPTGAGKRLYGDSERSRRGRSAPNRSGCPRTGRNRPGAAPRWRGEGLKSPPRAARLARAGILARECSSPTPGEESAATVRVASSIPSKYLYAHAPPADRCPTRRVGGRRAAGCVWRGWSIQWADPSLDANRSAGDPDAGANSRAAPDPGTDRNPGADA